MSTFTPNALYGSERYADFVTLDDAKRFLQIQGLDDSRDWALQHAVSAACAGVSRFCNRPIGATLYEPPYGVFNGGSGNTSSYIVLPKQPVLQVLSVVEYQGNTPVTLSEINPNGSASTYAGGDGYRVDYKSGIVERVMGGVWQRPWMPSEMGVWISWIAGMDPIPADIWFGTIQWASQLFRVTQQRMAGGSPLGHSAPSEESGGAWPGMPNWLKNALSTYIEPSIG